ncbi:hypothetical protein V8E54_006658 [Elaphomyces granulatus]
MARNISLICGARWAGINGRGGETIHRSTLQMGRAQGWPWVTSRLQPPLVVTGGYGSIPQTGHLFLKAQLCRRIFVREYSLVSTMKPVQDFIPLPSSELDLDVPKEDEKRQMTRNSHAREAELLDIASAKATGRSISRAAIEKEIVWLTDPKTLSERIERLLKKRDPGMAAALVRAAQNNGIECVVAWNHLMEYCMSAGAPSAAFKFFNDMKKRGNRPNPQTYTIMLKGLSQQFRHPGLNPVQTALSIYRSISAPNSAVKPNIIHTNAMLLACARHGDMGALWLVVSDLPEEGSNAPDRMTYSSILDAIRETAQRDVDRTDPDKVDTILEIRATAVRDGKKIWADIVRQWRNGKLIIDNYLVCAMARLLITGSNESDCYDVLALMNQTTGIPIFANKPPPSHCHNLSEQSSFELKERSPLFYAKNREQRDPGMDLEALENTRDEKRRTHKDVKDVCFDDVFNPVIYSTDVENQRPNKLSFLRPENINLTFILEACRLMTQAIDAGKTYWHHLTRENNCKIEPDSHTFNQYLRLLRVARSSKLSLDVIKDEMLPAKRAEGKSFYIAISCCRRDRKNPNILNTANQLLELMNSHLLLPDPRALVGYLELIDVLAANPQFLISSFALDVKVDGSSSIATMRRQMQLKLRMIAISHMRPHVQKLFHSMTKGRISKFDPKRRRSHRKYPEAIVGFLALRAMVRTRAMIDTVLLPEYEPLLSKLDRRQLESESKKLRVFSGVEMVAKFENSHIFPAPVG